MTEALQWRSRRITDAGLDRALRWADENGNGGLLDASDRLPRVELGERDGLLLLNAGLASRYRTHFATGPAAVTIPFHAPVSSDATLAERDVLEQDPAKRVVTREDLVEMMRRNGGHPIRLRDLAWLYPNAKIQGEGEVLSRLADRTIRTRLHPGGVDLGSAFLDPGGDLIVSHLYATELREAAPNFAQFMTNRHRGHPDPTCRTPSSAFRTAACSPDSWPVDLDTLLSRADLEMSPSLFGTVSSTLATRRSAIVDALRTSGLASVSTPTVDGDARVSVNLRDDNAREVLTFLNGRFSDLLCDPANADQIAFHLGGSRTGGPSIDALRRTLLAILDDPGTAVAYRDAEANSPATFNTAAGNPTLHFVARMSPRDTTEVVFGIYHIDAQSYQPPGQPLLDEIRGPDSIHYQHQGEAEPMFLRYRRSDASASLDLQNVYLGDHFVAEPVSPSDYAGRTIAVAYGSGGRILMQSSMTFEPGAMMSRGGRAVPFVAIPTVLGIFPYFEAYPGEENLTGPNQSAATFRPDTDGTIASGEYRVRIEGEGGDFLPTARVLSRNGRIRSGANDSGFPFLRGARDVGMSHERNRLDVSLFRFLERQDDYHENREIGRVGSLLWEAGPSWAGNADPGTPGFRLTFRHEVNTLLHLDQVGLGPLAAGLYVFEPFSWLANPYVPQFSAHMMTRPDFDPRWRVDMDIAEARFGIVAGGFQWMGQGRFGWNVGGTTTFQDVRAGLFASAGTYILFQRHWWEIGAGYEYSYQIVNPPAVTEPDGSPYDQGAHTVFGRAGVRFGY